MNAIPEKWYVLYKDKDEFNIITQHFKLCWEYYHAPDNCGYVNINEHCHQVNLKDLDNTGGSGWNLEKLKLNKAIQISFEDFEKYIVNKEPFKQDLSYLKLLLKKLKIK